MKMTGREIKRDLCLQAGLRPKDIRVRWGTGTASCWLDVMISNDLYPTVGEVVELIVDLSPQYGYGAYNSDFDGDRQSSVSVTNFDGRQILWDHQRRQDQTPKEAVGACRVNWQLEGF